MVLLEPETNMKLGGASFNEKKKAFLKSPLKLTQMVADFSKWEPAEIDERQEQLAELAVQVWAAPKQK